MKVIIIPEQLQVSAFSKPDFVKLKYMLLLLL